MEMKSSHRIILSIVVVILAIIAVVFAMRAKNDRIQSGLRTPLSGADTTNQSEPLTNQLSVSKPMTTTTAIFHTSLGDFTIELDTTNTPETASNFQKLASQGFYNGTKFHRVIEGFMIQGGDPLTKDDTKSDYWGTGGPGYRFADEIKPTNNNAPGTISMANSGPNTNGSQFFINVADNSYLNTKHTVFGKVISGYDVVEKISTVDTLPNDRPVTPVVITSIELK